MKQRTVLWCGFLLFLLASQTGCQGFSDDGKYPILLVIWNKYGQYGYIDREGEVRVPLQFAYATDFSEGLGGVNIGGTSQGARMPTNGRWGFVNQSGQFVINPDFFSPPEVGDPFDPESLALVQHEGYIFSEGLAAVYTVDRNWAYIDTTGQIVIQGDNILSARRFREGLANVYKDRRWGYINRQAEWVIEPQYLYPVEFQNGLAVVMNEDRELIVLRKDGTRILPQYRIESAFFNGVATVRERFKGQAIEEFDNRKFGLVDTSGRILFRPQFDALGRFGSGMVPILVGSKIGDPLVHPKPPEPTEVPGGKWGFADPAGRIVVNPVYEGTQGFAEGIGAIKQGGLWALIEPAGNRLTDHEFRWVDYCRDGIIAVRLGPTHSDYDGRYAYVDRFGKVIWIEPDIEGIW